MSQSASISSFSIADHQLNFDAKDEKNDEKKGLALIGTAPSFGNNDTAQRIILGWVDKHRLCMWNTREGFAFDQASTRKMALPRRTTPAAIYRAPEHAHNVLEGKKSVDALFDERFDSNGVSLNGQQIFPLLRWKESEKDPRYGRTFQPIEKGSPVNNLHRVGGYGGIPGAKITGEELERLQKTAEIIRQQMTQTEVLFVIDDTLSMGKWYRAATAACEKIINKLADRKHNLRAAVTYFNDVLPDSNFRDGDVPQKDPKLAVTTMKLKDFRSEGAKMVKEMLEHKEQGGGDPREQLFRGIYGGVEAAEFSRHARKMVIVIGDTGNNPRFDKKFKGWTEEEIASLLVPKGKTPIEFYAIQVLDPDEFARDPKHEKGDEDKNAVLAFRTEMNSILQFAKKRLDATEEFKDFPTGKYIHLQNEKDLIRELESRYEILEARAEDINRKIQQITVHGNVPAAGKMIETLFKEHGLEDVLERLKNSKGAQVFREGYVWENDVHGQRQISKKLLVSEADLRDLNDVLKSMLNDRVSETYLLKRMVSIQEGLKIEDLRDMKLGDILQKTHGFEFQSELFKQKLKDAHTFDFTKQEVKDLEHKQILLNNLLNGIYQDYERKEEVINKAKIQVWRSKGPSMKQDPPAHDSPWWRRRFDQLVLGRSR